MSALAVVPPLDPPVGRACSRCGTTEREVAESVHGRLCLSCYEQAGAPPRAIGLAPTFVGAPALPSRPAQSCGPSRGRRADRLSPVAHLSATAARCRALGVSATPLGTFRCVLAGHDHDARVHPTAAGWWGYTCSTGEGPYGLAEVYAFQRYGDIRPVSATEALRWLERLDYDAGLLDREPVHLLVPRDAPRAARRVADGIGLLIGLRAPLRTTPDGQEGWAQADPFPLARAFAAAWCGVSEKVARTGIAQLEALGLIERVGLVERAAPGRRAILWRLPQGGDGHGADGGDPPPPPEEPPAATGDGGPPDEDALISALIVAFDAEEVPEKPAEASRPSGAADGPQPCPYEQHRQHDWTAAGGRRVCGRCHPPADPAWARRGAS